MRKMMVLLAVLLLPSVATVVWAEQAPEKVVIDEAAAKKSAVEFPHKAHAEKIADCTTCHHTEEGLTATSGKDVATCASCHLDPKDPAAGSIREMSTSKNPFHKLCVDCHKKEAKGPTKCDECHPKG